MPTTAAARKGIYAAQRSRWRRCSAVSTPSSMAMNGRIERRQSVFFAAMVLDSLDGRVARGPYAETPLASRWTLSDMVSFGAAPALIVYVGAQGAGQGGLDSPPSSTAPARRCAGAFNTNTGGSSTSATFRALPAPAAAAALVIGLHLGDGRSAGCRRRGSALGGVAPDWLCSPSLFAGLTMVTNVPFYSFKDVSFGHVRCPSS